MKIDPAIIAEQNRKCPGRESAPPAPTRTFISSIDPAVVLKGQRAARGSGATALVKKRTPAVLALLNVARLPEGVTAKATAGQPNAWEKEFGVGLEQLKLAGQIVAWDYELIRLCIGVRAYYTPDFFVRFPDGRVQVFEIKGYRHQAGIVRFKVAAKMYPHWDFVMVTKIGGGWVYKPADAGKE